MLVIQIALQAAFAAVESGSRLVIISNQSHLKKKVPNRYGLNSQY